MLIGLRQAVPERRNHTVSMKMGMALHICHTVLASGKAEMCELLSLRSSIPPGQHRET